MMRIAILFMAFLATLCLALDAPIPGYTVEEITWDVEAFDNGTYVNITGTIEDVYTQLAKINPDFPRNNDSVKDMAMVNAQNDFGPVCNPRPNVWLPCAQWDVTDGIGYLRRVKGKAVLSPGPSSCARVSCSYNAAIWWCNDNKNTFELATFNPIADCAQVIVNDCTYQQKVVGQNFNGGNWNCIVRYDGDSC